MEPLASNPLSTLAARTSPSSSLSIAQCASALLAKVRGGGVTVRIAVGVVLVVFIFLSVTWMQ